MEKFAYFPRIDPAPIERLCIKFPDFQVEKPFFTKHLNFQGDSQQRIFGNPLFSIDESLVLFTLSVYIR